MSTTQLPATETLTVVPFLHPQGCRTYLLADPQSGQALALDVHLDLVHEVEERVRAEKWTLPYVVDSHTHADHPSGAGALAARFSSTRIAHQKAHHKGVARHPGDGETLHLGDLPVTVRHAPGHTPDHIVLLAGGALFSGDTLLIGGVARTDFLGGDAGVLHDTIDRLLKDLPDETLVYPGHDYKGREHSTVGEERRSNPWLKIRDRAEFVRLLTADAPPRPANMDGLLRLNTQGVDIPTTISAQEMVERVAAGGALSVIDVRMDFEVQAEHVAGSRHIPLDQLSSRLDEVRAVPAPRLLLCRTDSRARMALRTLSEAHVGGVSVVQGGIEAYRGAGGPTEKGRARMSLERQVRIGAGLMVLTGSVLGILVHIGFVGLAAFAGAGLVFAGVTDRCGMAMVLGRMPWNRVSATDKPASAGGCAATAPAMGGCAAGAPQAGGCAASPPPRD